MKILFVVTSLALYATALWPIPQLYTHGDSVLWLSPDVEFAFQPSLRSTAHVSMIHQLVQYVE